MIAQNGAIRRAVMSKLYRTRARRRLLFGLGLACVLMALLSVLNGCRQSRTNRQNEARELNVAAAANLSDPFNELGKQFTAQTAIRVVYSFGATAELAKQIENGAPFDLFAALCKNTQSFSLPGECFYSQVLSVSADGDCAVLSGGQRLRSRRSPSFKDFRSRMSERGSEADGDNGELWMRRRHEVLCG
jgi:hypothetical protein